tara:strand:+ start:772 stop:1536 length:765 start_codon:yes stop_codon:yes gene_type:complete
MDENYNLKNGIINQFIILLKDYFTRLISCTLNEFSYNNCFQIGIHAFIRVFEYVLFQTKSLEKAHIYSEKSQILFLEYLEQIQDSGYLQELDVNEIVLFVYKKTIFKINEQENEADIINNMMTLSDTSVNFDEKDYHELFVRLQNTADTLFYWNNKNITNQNRIEISQKFFETWYLLSENKYLLLLLEYIHQEFSIDYSDYKIVLKEIIEINKKNKFKDLNESFFINKFTLEKELLKEKYQKVNIKQFIKWLVT